MELFILVTKRVGSHCLEEEGGLYLFLCIFFLFKFVLSFIVLFKLLTKSLKQRSSQLVFLYLPAQENFMLSYIDQQTPATLECFQLSSCIFFFLSLLFSHPSLVSVEAFKNYNYCMILEQEQYTNRRELVLTFLLLFHENVSLAAMTVLKIFLGFNEGFREAHM